MRQAVTRIWQAMRDHLTRWFAAGPPPPAKVVTHPAAAQAAVPEAAPAAAPAVQTLPPPGMPSVAVLAFNNVSGEAGQEDLADAITDDITTQLSRSSTLFVVARGSSFAYKGQSMKLAQLGQKLGAGYLLGGNVRRDGDQGADQRQADGRANRKAGVGRALRTCDHRSVRGAGRDRGRGSSGDCAADLGGRTRTDRLQADRVASHDCRHCRVRAEYRMRPSRLTNGRRRRVS